MVRGLLRDGVPVKKGDRIADIDPRGQTDDLDHISDKAHRVAEGVHEALMGLLAEVAQRQSDAKKNGRKLASKTTKKKRASTKKKASAAKSSRANAPRPKSAKRGKGTAKG